MFLTQQVWMDSWNANFTFVLESPASNAPNLHEGGFSFLVQADNIVSAGPNDDGLGYGAYPNGVGQGFRKSLAIEFDTFMDPGVDDTLLPGESCSAPHFAIHSMGAEPNSAVEKDANFAKKCYNQFNDPYPDKVHTVRITYRKPVLSVYCECSFCWGFSLLLICSPIRRYNNSSGSASEL